MLHVPMGSEISPLRNAFVEMTIGVPAANVISSGGCAPIWMVKTLALMKR